MRNEADMAARGAGWSRRATVVALCFLAMVIAYTDRVNIAVAAVAMREELGWSQTTKGLVLSAFYVGYMAFMLPAGWLSQRFGGRRALGVAVIVWSLCTVLTPIAARYSLSALVAVRIAMGIGEAAIFPAILKLYGTWIPPLERTRAVAAMMNGIPVGTVVGFLVSGALLVHFAWPAVMYVFGLVGLLWAMPWFATVRDRPADDPGISKEERVYLAQHVVTESSSGAIPWRALLSSASTWSLIGAQFATTWTLFVLLSWLPSYFRDVQKLSAASAGLFSSLPWVAMALCSLIAAPVSDLLIRRGLSMTRARQLFQCVGLVGSAVLLLAVRDVASANGALAVLCSAAGVLGFTWCGYAPAYIDIAPRHSAIVAAMGTTIGTIPGVIGVAFTGWLVETTGTYAAAFAAPAVISFAGATAFLIFFRAVPLSIGSPGGEGHPR